MIGKLLTGRYLILKKLAVGGFSETYLAVDKYLPEQPICVVKHLKPLPNSTLSLAQAQQSFEQEARILDRLGRSHSQIPTLLAYFQEENQVYQVEEYIRGRNLEDWYMQGHCLSVEMAIDLLKQVLAILNDVHRQNIIHQDVKPSNLIWQEDGQIVLIDFGAACDLSRQAFQGIEPEKPIAIGTMGYMPDEQQKGHPQFNSDLYALGVCTIQLLVGLPLQQLSFDAASHDRNWQHYLEQDDPGLVAILEKMVKTDYRDRFQSATEALVALQSLSTAPVSHRQRSEVKPVSQASNALLHKLFKPALVLVSVALLGGVYYLFATDWKIMLRQPRYVDRLTEPCRGPNSVRADARDSGCHSNLNQSMVWF